MSKSKTKVVHVSGKRKSAIARATVKEGNGKVIINGTPIDLFSNKFYSSRIKEAILLSDELASKVNITVKVIGGGVAGQAEAARLAIARAIIEYFDNEDLKQTYLNYDRQLLIADIRRKETRKPNRSKARAKRQKSYR